MTIYLTNPLHLYRATLRETTYLFDRNARRWAYQYVTSSYRQHAAKLKDGKQLRTVPYNPYHTPSQHERHLLKRGRRFLVLLQRANQGYQRQLRNLLQLVYGRKGRRKRALTTPFIHAPPQEVSSPRVEGAEARAPENGSNNSPEKFSKQWKPPEDFLSLLNAQNRLSSYLSIRRTIQLKSPVQEKNKWNRPMPPSRVKNTNRKWYARLAAAFMPPLPEQEWMFLKNIATRKQELKIIPRRPVAKMTAENQQAEDADTASSIILTGNKVVMTYKAAQSIQSPHQLTPRFLSRFYARHILNHVPVVEPNPMGRGLVSKWDDAKRNTLAPAQPTKAQIDALFE